MRAKSPIDHAADLINTVNNDLSNFARQRVGTTEFLAGVQARATQAVAASLLAIADEMRLAREKGVTGE